MSGATSGGWWTQGERTNGGLHVQSPGGNRLWVPDSRVVLYARSLRRSIKLARGSCRLAVRYEGVRAFRHRRDAHDEIKVAKEDREKLDGVTAMALGNFLREVAA